MPKKHDFDMEDVGGRKTVIVLCVDTSNSLYSWQREVNNAIKAFFAELDNEPKARYGTEVAVVAYDTKPRLHAGFTSNKTSIKPISIPDKNASGGWTDIGEALKYSIDLAIGEWKRLKASGIPVYLPWVILFTDGKPENKERNAEQKLMQAASYLQTFEYPQKKNDKILFIGIGVGANVDVELMRKISAHGSVRYLHADNFSMLSKLFKFVGATTVTSVGQEKNYDGHDSSFSFQAPKNDQLDMSGGGFGALEESPVFSSDTMAGFGTPSVSAYQQPAGLFQSSSITPPTAVPQQITFSDQSAARQADFTNPFATQNNNGAPQMPPQQSNPFAAPTQAQPQPVQVTPSKVNPGDLDSLLEEMMRISTSNAFID